MAEPINAAPEANVTQDTAPVVEQGKEEGQTEGQAEGQEAPAKEEINGIEQQFKSALPKGAEIITHEGKAYLKQKIDGEVTYKPLEDIIRDYSKSSAADKKLQDAKLKAKEVENYKKKIETEFLDLLKNPEMYYKYRRQAGFKEDEDYDTAAKLLEQGIKRKEMTPEQRELEELKEWRAKQEQELQKTKQTEEQKRLEEQTEIHRQAITSKIIDTLKKNNITEKTDGTVRSMLMTAMLQEMASAERYGFTPEEFTAQDALEKVNRDAKGFLDYYLGIVPDHQILSMIPKRVIDLIRRGGAEPKTVTPTANSLKPTKQTEYKPKPQKKETFKWSEWNNKFGG